MKSHRSPTGFFRHACRAFTEDRATGRSIQAGSSALALTLDPRATGSISTNPKKILREPPCAVLAEMVPG